MRAIAKVALSIALPILAITQSVGASTAYSIQAFEAPFQTASSKFPGTFISGINDLGDVVGYYQEGDPLAGLGGPAGVTYQAFKRDLNGTFSKINPPDATRDSFATGVNNAGVVSGYFTDTSNNTHGYLLTGTQFEILDVPGPGPTGPASTTIALGLNSHGDVVGSYYSGLGTTISPSIDGFALHDGIYSDVIVPGVSASMVQPATGFSAINHAFGINSNGDVVGYYFARYDPNSYGLHGFLLSNGGYQTLDYPGTSYHATTAFGINDAGQIVGDFEDEKGPHAYLYSDGIFTPLDILGINRGQAFGINNRGQIVGNFVDDDGTTRGFIASPVPLPQSALFFGTALLVTIKMRRRVCSSLSQ